MKKLIIFLLVLLSLVMFGCKDPVESPSSTSKTMQDISISESTSHKVEYVLGDVFDPTGLKLLVKYTDGSSETIAYSESNSGGFSNSNFSFTSKGWNSNFEFVCLGSISITLKYKDKSTEFNVIVNDIINDDFSAIYINNYPYCVEYNLNDKFSPDGLVIALLYEDDSVVYVNYSDFTANDFSFESEGFNENLEFIQSGVVSIKVTYKGKSVYFDVTVNSSVISKDIIDVQVKNPPNKINYSIGEVFDPSGLVLTIFFNDDTTLDVSFDKNGNNGDLTWNNLPEYTGTYDFILYYQEFWVSVKINIVQLYSISNGILTIYQNTPDYDKEFTDYIEENGWNFEYGSSIFEMIGKYGKVTPWYNKRDSITKIVVQDGVNKIGNHSFQYLENVTEVVLPDGIECIGVYAFNNCTALKKINIPDGLEILGMWAFGYCSSLESISINGNYLSMGHSAFYNCKSLTSVILNGITQIPSEAFRSADSLTEIEIPEGVTKIGSFAFSSLVEKVTLPSTLTNLGNQTFGTPYGRLSNGEYSPDLEVHFRGTIEQWCAIEVDISKCDDYDTPSEAGLSRMRTLYIGSDSESEVLIDDELVIPEGVASICINAFCIPSLKTVYLPSTLKKIDYSAFMYAENITEVYFDGTFDQWLEVESVNSLSSPAWNGATVYYKNESDEWVTIVGELVISENVGASAFINNMSITSVIIEEGVTSIGASAFKGCKNITSVTFPSTLTEIGERAFYDCESLTEITIPGSVKTISESAFGFCESLRTVVIEEGVETIKKSAFWTPNSLETLIIPATVKEIGSSAFYPQSNRFRGYPVHIYYGGDILDWLSLKGEVYYESGSGEIMELIEWYGGELYINNQPVSENLVIPEGVTKLPTHAFAGLPIKKVSLPRGLLLMGSDCFDGAEFTTITIPEGMQDIRLSICDKLETVNFTGTLDNCEVYIKSKVLKNITIPEGASSVNLDYCASLETANLPNTVTYLRGFKSCKLLKSITIPASVTKIDFSIFANCEALESVLFEDPTGWLDPEGNSQDFSDPASNASMLKAILSYKSGYFTKE